MKSFWCKIGFHTWVDVEPNTKDSRFYHDVLRWKSDLKRDWYGLYLDPMGFTLPILESKDRICMRCYKIDFRCNKSSTKCATRLSKLQKTVDELTQRKINKEEMKKKVEEDALVLRKLVEKGEVGSLSIDRSEVHELDDNHTVI